MEIQTQKKRTQLYLSGGNQVLRDLFSAQNYMGIIPLYQRET